MTQRHPPAEDAIVLDEIIHQPTRLRIMTLLVSLPPSDLLAFGFIQEQLRLTPGNLTIHLRKLSQAGYLSITKEFIDSKPRTWISATDDGRTAFANYLANLERTLNWRPREWPTETPEQRRSQHRHRGIHE